MGSIITSIQQRRGKDLASEARYDHVFAVAYGSFFTSFGTEQSDYGVCCLFPFLSSHTSLSALWREIEKGTGKRKRDKSKRKGKGKILCQRDLSV